MPQVDGINTTNLLCIVLARHIDALCGGGDAPGGRRPSGCAGHRLADRAGLDGGLHRRPHHVLQGAAQEFGAGGEGAGLRRRAAGGLCGARRPGRRLGHRHRRPVGDGGDPRPQDVRGLRAQVQQQVRRACASAGCPLHPAYLRRHARPSRRWATSVRSRWSGPTARRIELHQETQRTWSGWPGALCFFCVSEAGWG